MDTVWVLGDQLHRDLAHLRGLGPRDARVLLVRSDAKVQGRRWHRQRLHLVLTAMARFARELEDEGFAVDVVRAPSLAAGVAEHRARHRPGQVRVMEPASWDLGQRLPELGVEVVRNDQFLCHPDEFAAWAATRRGRLRMEDFYRHQRVHHDVLMDGDAPAGGRWNFDAENREPPPRDGRAWPEPDRVPLDALDHEIIASLPDDVWGAPPDGLWPTSRAHALARLQRVVDEVLSVFGPHEDAMLTSSWQMAHTLLSSSLNLGLLHPREVVDAAEAAYRAGRVPIASAEGFVRQVLGWREYVWGISWLWMPGYRDENALDAHRALPPVLRGEPTRMRCVETTMATLHQHGWVHHIQRLMVLGNLGLLAGVDPQAMTGWMWESFVDGAEWVMLPNVVGMALHADGGRMATKPYAGSGAYIQRMSDCCTGCAYRPRERVGERACPFTTLYWDFLARHRERFARNHRMGNQLASLRRLGDLDAVRAQAVDTLARLDAGTL